MLVSSFRPSTDPDPGHRVALDVLIDGLRAQSVPCPALDALVDRLGTDARAIPLGDLDFDSLGLMEFCIHLELDHGVPITPDDVLEMTLVGQLLDAITAHQAP